MQTTIIQDCVLLEIYAHLPKQRRLDSVEEETENMTRLGVNKKLLQLHVRQVTGKVTRISATTQATKTDLAAMVEQLSRYNVGIDKLFLKY